MAREGAGAGAARAADGSGAIRAAVLPPDLPGVDVGRTIRFLTGISGQLWFVAGPLPARLSAGVQIVAASGAFLATPKPSLRGTSLRVALPLSGMTVELVRSVRDAFTKPPGSLDQAAKYPSMLSCSAP